MTIMCFLLIFAFILTEHAASTNQFVLADGDQLPPAPGDDISADDGGDETDTPCRPAPAPADDISRDGAGDETDTPCITEEVSGA